jgi:hypothetical protein
MAYTIARLRACSDDELIAAHDSMVPNVSVGISYFLEELRRRDADRAEAAAYELGRRAYWLSIINGVLAMVSAAAAVTAILIAH